MSNSANAPQDMSESVNSGPEAYWLNDEPDSDLEAMSHSANASKLRPDVVPLDWSWDASEESEDVPDHLVYDSD